MKILILIFISNENNYCLISIEQSFNMCLFIIGVKISTGFVCCSKQDFETLLYDELCVALFQWRFNDRVYGVLKAVL